MVIDKENGLMALQQWFKTHPTLPRKIGELSALAWIRVKTTQNFLKVKTKSSTIQSSIYLAIFKEFKFNLRFSIDYFRNCLLS